MGQDDNPTPPTESATGTPPAADEPKRENPSVQDLLAASRGDVVKREATPTKDRAATPVTPSAREASTGTRAEGVPPGDVPGKSVPAGTSPAARAVPATGASKTSSTPTAAINKGVSKAVAARTPAGPIVQSEPEPTVNKLRRRIVWASVASFMSVSFLMFLRFFLPRAIFEPSSIFRIGFPGDYAVGVDTKWQQQYRVWVVRNTERLFVIYAVCTHLGCTPDWKASENKFKCPCHGSGYDSEGVAFEGPAPRPMDRAEITLDAEGQLVVNKGRLYTWPKGGVNQFDDEGAFIRT
ncbi:MAG: Rieske 2Fe-2S domain-containing protein [Acidobacteria bacterium]|nr:Rieske 2Fe-2S domain-containing protein [Acidobacteriota bacterium]